MKKLIKWLGYIILLVLVYVFAYLFNLNENYILLYMLVLLPVADFAYFTIVKNKCEVQLVNENSAISRGQENKYIIIIENKGKVSIPFLDYKININNHFVENKFICERIDIGRLKSFVKNFNLESLHIGVGEVNVQEIEIRSLFGFFSKKYQINEKNDTAILPDYKKIFNLCQVLEIGEGMDLENEIDKSVFIGEPGYEYKEYAEGDPLNRVNWKLSSKQNKLMVRKSISSSKLTKMVLLDYGAEDSKKILYDIDLIAETYLSIVLELVRMEYEVGAILRNETYREIFLENEHDIEDIRVELGKYKFSYGNEDRFSSIDIDSLTSSDLIIVTQRKDDVLYNFVSVLERKGIDVIVISNNSKKLFDNEAYINEKYVLERI